MHQITATTDTMQTLREVILSLLPSTSRHIADKIGGRHDSVSKRLRRLSQDGEVIVTGSVTDAETGIRSMIYDMPERAVEAISNRKLLARNERQYQLIKKAFLSRPAKADPFIAQFFGMTNQPANDRRQPRK